MTLFNPEGSNSDRKPNRLAGSTSPYLLQHQWNPVDWYPWCEQAIAKAVSENKPIFLSIGYSACHWCHVMERESFEDESIGAYLAEHFVAIKVDREQRPDLDQIYMQSVQMMTGSGGWPMSVFMTPDCKPFYCGTYWPPVPKWGKPSFRQVLKAIVDAWRDRRQELEEQAAQVVASLSNSTIGQGWEGAAGENLDDSALQQASMKMLEAFDPNYGGFSGAPKFPSPMALHFLMRLEHRQSNAQRRHAILKTLDSMAAGGIFDHLGGGFSRYSVDDRWLVPHFEKMLYDNALLAAVYVDAYALFGESRYRETAERTLDYLLKDLRHPEGGFFSAEDADSDGEEGKYYVWTTREIVDVLGAEQAEIFCAVYDVTESGNFEGKSVLNLIVPPEAPMPVKDPAKLEMMAARFSISIDDLKGRLECWRQALLARRAMRIRPGKDDKILLAWNALAIGALARAGTAFSRPDYLAAAVTGYEFLRDRLQRPDGRWFHVWRDQCAEVDAFLDDYAYLADALLTLYECSGDQDYLRASNELVELVLHEFSDDGRAGFFYTGVRSERLVARMKDWTDHSLPSGNGMMATLLDRLAGHLDREDYRSLADGIVRACGSWIERAPHAVGQTLIAAEAQSVPCEKWTFTTDSVLDARLQRWLEGLRAEYAPHRILEVVSDDRLKDKLPIVDIVNVRPEVIAIDRESDAKVWLSVCRGSTCLAPVVGWDAIDDWLSTKRKVGSVDGIQKP